MTFPNTKRRKQRNESNCEENEDRLSDLPDGVLLHILSFLNAKDAVRSCVLSTRWKHLWKRIPTLTLSYLHFWTLKDFDKFVSRILSLRDGSTALHDLNFDRIGSDDSRLLKRMVKYAVSHNVQRLRISVSCWCIEPILPCIFSCQTLTSLTLDHPMYYAATSLFPNSLNLPALTSLYLKFFAFRGSNDGRAEPFSALKRLNSLTIDYCEVVDAQTLCISSTTLVNLTIRRDYHPRDYSTIELHAPSLRLFAVTGTPFQKLSGSHLSSIQQVNIDADMVCKIKPPFVPLSWLIQLSNIKSLTVIASDVKVLSLVPDLLNAKLSCLCNLKSLKVKMNPPQLDAKRWKDAFKRGLEGSSSIPDGIVDSLLQSSPLTEVDIIELIRL